jgi:RNA polymerase sigma factor (sigma-70 family)
MEDGTGKRWTMRSKRLLAIAGDDRLVEQIRRGNELAFEVAFERHGAGILGFCRHMVGSQEEAEDAVQHTFAAAYRSLRADDDRAIALKPWLYAIARNRCISVLRARRADTVELDGHATAGLDEEVERRAELRDVLADIRELPEEQRAALLLAEAADMSHPEVAQVLGCEVERVKALVFRARSGLIERRDARESPCGEIREQLANLRGGALRRSRLTHHLRHCPGCSAYREEVRRQRQLLAVALPVVPTAGLQAKVLAAAGLAGGAGTAGAAGAAGTAAGGAVLGSSLGSATIAKVAIVGVLAGGGLVAGDAVVERVGAADGPDRPPAATATPRDADSTPRPNAGTDVPGAHVDAPGRSLDPPGVRRSEERSHGRRGAERRSERSQAGGQSDSAKSQGQSGNAKDRGRGTDEQRGRALGHEKQADRGAATPQRSGKADKQPNTPTPGGAEPPPSAGKPADPVPSKAPEVLEAPEAPEVPKAAKPQR